MSRELGQKRTSTSRGSGVDFSPTGFTISYLSELQFLLGVRTQGLGVDSTECTKQQYTVKQKNTKC
jgi:hypothetical protein